MKESCYADPIQDEVQHWSMACEVNGKAKTSGHFSPVKQQAVTHPETRVHTHSLV